MAVKSSIAGLKLLKLAPVAQPGDWNALRAVLCDNGVRLHGNLLGLPGESATLSSSNGRYRQSTSMPDGWIGIGHVQGGPTGPIVLVTWQYNLAEPRRMQQRSLPAAAVRSRFTSATDGLLKGLRQARIPTLVEEVRVQAPRHRDVAQPAGFWEICSYLSNPVIAAKLRPGPRLSGWLRGAQLKADDADLRRELAEVYQHGLACSRVGKMQWWHGQLTAAEKGKLALQGANGHAGAADLLAGNFQALPAARLVVVSQCIEQVAQGRGISQYSVW